MKHIVLSLFLLVLSFTLTVAEKQKGEKQKGEKLTKGDATLKNVPKQPPPRSAGAPLNIDEVCKETSSKPSCVETLTSMKVGNGVLTKPRKFAAEVVKYAQGEFGQTSTKAREKMREDDLKLDIKKALSHCVKFYLDIADELRGLYLAAKTKEFESGGIDFGLMGKHFPKNCEDELNKAGTSGADLKLYKSYKDLENLASTVDAVFHYVAIERKGGKH